RALPRTRAILLVSIWLLEFRRHDRRSPSSTGRGRSTAEALAWILFEETMGSGRLSARKSKRGAARDRRSAYSSKAGGASDASSAGFNSGLRFVPAPSIN